MSGYPLLHPGLTPAQDWSDQGASLDSDKWVSTPPSWSDSLHHYWLDQGHVWTEMNGYPLLHPGLTPVLVGPGGISGLRQVGVHSSILVRQLAPLLVRPGACLDSDEWVSTPPSWSDPCPGLVGPGGISGLRQV